MQVTSANHHAHTVAKPAVADRAKRSETEIEPRPEQIPANPAAATEAQQERGVIRLLEEGHFKGVADVRLRINFYNELTAGAEQQAAASLPENVGALRDQTMAAFDEVISTLGLNEEHADAAQQLCADFSAAVVAAGDAAVASGNIDRTGLDASLREAFDALVAGLREFAAPPVTEEPADQPDVVETTATAVPAGGEEEGTDDAVPEPPVSDPFAPLVKVFEDAVAGLQQSLTAGLQLPELTPPQNNGGAYEKFLAIYNSLLSKGQPGTGEDSPSVELSA